MVFVLNLIALFAVFIIYALLHSVINVALVAIGLGKNSGLSILAGLLSSLLSVLIATYLTYLALGYFDTNLSFIPVLIWAILQTLGSARDGVNSRIQSTNMSAIEHAQFESNNGVNLKTQSFVFLGQFWGLIIGGIGAVVYLAFIA